VTISVRPLLATICIAYAQWRLLDTLRSFSWQSAREERKCGAIVCDVPGKPRRELAAGAGLVLTKGVLLPTGVGDLSKQKLLFLKHYAVMRSGETSLSPCGLRSQPYVAWRSKLCLQRLKAKLPPRDPVQIAERFVFNAGCQQTNNLPSLTGLGYCLEK